MSDHSAISIPRGATGQQGASGSQGLQGLQGPSGSAGTSFTWVIQSPASGGVPGPRLGESRMVTRVDAFVTNATSCAINIEKRTTIGSVGNALLSSDLTATVGGATTSTFASSSISAGDWLWVDISSVVGTPMTLTINLATVI
jgi:hypothetical protein